MSWRDSPTASTDATLTPDVVSDLAPRVDLGRASSAFGALLTTTHLLTAYFWWNGLPRLASQAATCWPQFPDCERYRPLWQSHVRTGLVVYGVAALATTLLFVSRRYPRAALGALVVLTVAKLAVIAQDFNLMGNYHDMALMATIAYVMAPRRLDVAQAAVVAFYVGAGALKIHPEWLSGAAMIRPSVFTHTFFERYALAYVVILELVLVFGLLSRSALIRWLTFAQLALFHAFSWHVVGFFYPCVMTCLLGLFPLAWRDGLQLDLASLVRLRASRPVYAFIGVFTLCQLTPALYAGDAALTGEGRFLSLDMFDAFAKCEHFAFATSPERHVIVEESLVSVGAVRTHCDPIVFWNHFRRVCASLPEDAHLDDVLYSRRSTARHMDRVYALTDVCKEVPVLTAILPTPWLEGSAQPP